MQNENKQNDQRRVLITGACGGIGRVLCQRFIAAGDFVYALDHDVGQLNELLATVNTTQCTIVAADITDAAALEAALAPAIKRHGPVDVVVANAGAAASTTIANTSASNWCADIDLNLNGTFHTIEAVRNAMQDRQRGNIVIIGSVNGMSALGHPAYSAAKAGLISYTKSLALELGKFGIRANIVCPGTVQTQAWQARVEANPQVFDELKKWVPLGDFATPDDIADAVLFLTSSAARVITGVALPVDGGLMAGNRLLTAELTQQSI